MDEQIERMVVSVRADTAGFARDVAAMRASWKDHWRPGSDAPGD